MSLTWLELSAILDRPIAFHPIFGRIGGGTVPGVFMSQAFYWTRVQDQNAPDAEGWFYKTRDEWKTETCLTRYEQESARKAWRDLGILEEEKRGMPAKTHFRINKPALLKAISDAVHMDSFGTYDVAAPVGGKPANKVVGKPPARRGKTSQQGGGKVTSMDAEKPPALVDTENTPETTQRTENTAEKKSYLNNNKTIPGRYAPEVYDTLLRRLPHNEQEVANSHRMGREKFLETYYAPHLIGVCNELRGDD